MPGQPAGEFDVTALRAVEPGDPPNRQQNIIDLNEAFNLEATFDGAGQTWAAMEQNGWQFNARFFAEGLGPGVPNRNFGAQGGALMTGGGPYTVTLPVPNGIGAQGLYRCGVFVVFSVPGGGPWWGWLGWADCMIMVHPSEEWPP
jgi:hypothetical protein